MMNQLDLMRQIASLADAEDGIIVADIGSQSLWLAAAKDRLRNFYLTGPMGSSVSIALGLALARPDQSVICVIGDGGLVMNLSALITAAGQKPNNLTVCVIDNGIYNFTGLISLPSGHLQWTELVDTLGAFMSITDETGIRKLEGDHDRGMTFIHAKVKPYTGAVPGHRIVPREEFKKIRSLFN
jgi:thiamine pyrophosphate-dependent acetolactate synthase large subunit-like protein